LFNADKNEKQLWVYLLQKALAICLGGYEQLENAETSKILHMLTGSNLLVYKVREDPVKNDKLFSVIKGCSGKNFFINCEKLENSLMNLQRSNTKPNVIYRV